MKQKRRCKNFNVSVTGIGYWFMNGRYIDIDPKKAISVDLQFKPSKDSASLLLGNEKRFQVSDFFVGDVINGGGFWRFWLR